MSVYHIQIDIPTGVQFFQLKISTRVDSSILRMANFPAAVRTPTKLLRTSTIAQQ